MRVHPTVGMAIIALVVIIGYDKLKGGSLSKSRIGT